MAHPLGPVIGYAGPRKTLLAVDDQPEQRQMLASLLDPLGFTVHEAASGSECLDSLNDTQPDAILLDISMDEMDGWQTAKAIRARGLTMPIIMVSANLFDNTPENMQAAPCQAFVGKPVLESELIGVLGKFLSLEWISANLGTPEHLQEAAQQAEIVRETIPTILRDRLMPLLRIGHVQGLLDVLDEHGRQEPSHKQLTAQLRNLVMRFDFATLSDLIKEHEHE